MPKKTCRWQRVHSNRSVGTDECGLGFPPLPEPKWWRLRTIVQALLRLRLPRFRARLQPSRTGNVPAAWLTLLAPQIFGGLRHWGMRCRHGMPSGVRWIYPPKLETPPSRYELAVREAIARVRTSKA